MLMFLIRTAMGQFLRPSVSGRSGYCVNKRVLLWTTTPIAFAGDFSRGCIDQLRKEANKRQLPPNVCVAYLGVWQICSRVCKF